MKRDFKVVHHSVAKVDSLSMALGKPLYVPDLVPPGALQVKMLWSPHAHARIVSIDTTEAEAMPGVRCILHHENVPRIEHTTAGQGHPEPSPYDTFMFDNKVRHVGDRVAAVAADTVAQAEAAVDAIKVEYEVLPPILDAEVAMDEGAPVIHDEPEAHVVIPTPFDPARNLAAQVGMDIGKLEDGLAEADAVCEDEYAVHFAQHCPMEPHCAFAQVASDGRLYITTSTQVPFHVRRIVSRIIEVPIQKIRVIKPRIGGGFGTKQEILLEGVVALMAWRTGKPVYWKYTREEEFVSSRTRHPVRIRMKLGAKKDGTMTAISMDALSNTGAYGAHSLTVACNVGGKMLPLYRCPNIHFDAQVVYTNMPVPGAYRGYGATQAAFPLECMMDELAEKLGIDPLKLRTINHIKAGETSPVFRALGEGKPGIEQSIGSCALGKCISEGAKAIGWKKRGQPAKKKGRFRRGIGMACLMQGSSIPEIDMGAATMKMNEDGSFNLLVGATDIGTGSDTVLAQIAAETLGTAAEKMIVYSSDTDLTPFDVGAYASSTTYLSGAAVLDCASKVRKQILAVGGVLLGCKPVDLTTAEGLVVKKDGTGSVTFSEVALHSLYTADQHQIGAISSKITHKSPPPFAAHFAEVEVDTWTGRIKLLNYVAAVDCGTAINPKLAEGQSEGATLNGISYALTEEYLFSPKGKVMNANFSHYKIFSMVDKPTIQTLLIPSYETTGPCGAKSVSEISINGPIPAIGNAIYNATGVRLKKTPFTADRVWAALKAAGIPQG
ncbi:MAG: molybdopterin-dependent oxidoreductase [Kiritimatiellae bacterium]|nr:molybdopterin-dependent oxidoreductase [Kiritimatiellia bacterium]